MSIIVVHLELSSNSKRCVASLSNRSTDPKDNVLRSTHRMMWQACAVLLWETSTSLSTPSTEVNIILFILLNIPESASICVQITNMFASCSTHWMMLVYAFQPHRGASPTIKCMTLSLLHKGKCNPSCICILNCLQITKDALLRAQRTGWCWPMPSILIEEHHPTVKPWAPAPGNAACGSNKLFEGYGAMEDASAPSHWLPLHYLDR